MAEYIYRGGARNKCTVILRYTEDGIPVVAANRYPNNKGTPIRFWCVDCKCWHSHGSPDLTEIDAGHRTAHCVEGGRFKKTGYFIEIVKEKLQHEF